MYGVIPLVCTGNNTLDDFMVQLIHIVELFRQQLDADILEEVSNLEYYVFGNFIAWVLNCGFSVLLYIVSNTDLSLTCNLTQQTLPPVCDCFV